MSLYYVLANTVVTGEIVIQGISITYSASASAFDSANTSFQDAAKVAVIDSNAAAIIAARKTVNDILAQYSYVLSEVDINSMISNSLKTDIHPIIPIALRLFTNTLDGVNFVVNKNVNIGSYEMIDVGPGQHLQVPSFYRLNGQGYIVTSASNRNVKTPARFSQDISYSISNPSTSKDAIPIPRISSYANIINGVGTTHTIYGRNSESDTFTAVPISWDNSAIVTNNGRFEFINAYPTNVKNISNGSLGTFNQSLSGSTIIKPQPLSS